MAINRKTLKRKLYFILGPLKKYLLNRGFRKRAIYSKARKVKPINQKMVFYEAYHGQSMTSNPYAVFTYLINDPKFKDYQHIWAVANKSAIPDDFKNRPNIKFIRYQSITYVKYLAIAKFLINDTTFPSYFHKRKGQVYANIWHGTPFKTMGLDIKNRGHTDHANIQRNFLCSDFFVTPNLFTAEKLLKSHDVYSIFNGKIVDTGYPRVDLMFKADKEEIRRKLSVPPKKKVILYAPTWRGNVENRSEQFIQNIQEKISTDYFILIKAHYYAERTPDHFVPNTLDTNELLAIVDILITDYSSIFFEFLPTKNPIIYYAYDSLEYERERGTYINIKELPGPICENIDEVAYNINHIESVKSTYREHYNTFSNKFCYHDDGNATARFVDVFFHGIPSDNMTQTKTDKTKILMYGGGFLNNGITASVINLLNAIDYDHYDVTLIDHGNNGKEEKWRNVKRLNKNVNHLFRVGTWNTTLFDWYRHTLLFRRGIYTKFMKKVAPTHMYKNEFERITGTTEFDIGIDFSGYSPFWAALFAFGKFKKKNIFLHSDMDEEMNKKVDNKYPHRKNLKVVFSLYTFFNAILSVSKLTHEKNVELLKPIVKYYDKKMDYVINSIDYNKIHSLKSDYQYEFGAEHDVTSLLQNLYIVPNEADINFITIGRLGPEKDHKKLINAFSFIATKHKNVKLYIVGNGALQKDLMELTKGLKLENKVIFTGQVSNPYTLLNKCDCFILSSNHEGQPIVLLEALILGKPIIVTDIPGSRSVIEGGYGLIVNNSVSGLINGMNQFINGEKLNEKTFDHQTYQNNAIYMFYEKACRLD